MRALVAWRGGLFLTEGTIVVRSAVEQMRQWQQALQADQIMDAGPKRVSSLSAFQITETKEGGMMVTTTT